MTRQEKRWLRKARRVFRFVIRCDGEDRERQLEYACDLARDVFRTLDPRGWRETRS